MPVPAGGAGPGADIPFASGGLPEGSLAPGAAGGRGAGAGDGLDSAEKLEDSDRVRIRVSSAAPLAPAGVLSTIMVEGGGNGGGGGGDGDVDVISGIIQERARSALL